MAGIERHDGPEQAVKLAARLVAYRVFADAAGKMNRSVRDVGGALLLVPQFTLAADTAAGLRPSFSRAAPPAEGAQLLTPWWPRWRRRAFRTPAAASAPI